ncbi:MAG TPA: M43 family zinc metalloprotease [Polyangiales bacterium]|nr:M43 family zinc metalloprotease [Polyangiales bacterium]
MGRLHPLSVCVAMADLPFEVETRPNAFSGDIDALDLPPTAAPTLFVIEHLDDDDWPVPPTDTTCRPPLCAVTLAPRGGETWFDREQLTDPEGPINPLAVGDHVHPLSVLIPNGPRAQPSDKGYRLQLETKHAGRARVTRVAVEPGEGRLDLNVFYVGTIVTSEQLREALSEVDRIFEQAELSVGELREIEVTGELLERGADLPDAEVSRGFAVLKRQYGVYPQLPELFKLSAGAANVALDVFLVADIEAGSADLGGIAGGTPVPFGMHGTGASGIAISADMFEPDPPQLGRVLAHELGHALGLFHTTERDGEVFDPFPDTPSCDKQRDRNGNGLEASECQGAGADNLMFPSTDAEAARLTEQQTAQLRAAMILR